MTKSPIQWQDKAYFSPERTVLTAAELNIPGLLVVGRHHMATAVAPLPDHFHPSGYEFTVVLEGTLHFTAGNLDYSVAGGDLFFTRPGEIHSTNHLPLAKGDIFWFQLDPEAADMLFLTAGAAADLRLRLRETHGHKTPQLPKVSLQLCKAISLDFSAPSGRYVLANHIVHLLYSLLSHLEQKERLFTEDIDRVLTFIEMERHQELTLEQLARVANLSVSQLKQKFKVQVGMAPRNYINQVKVESAKADLLTGQSITTVAMNYSFSSSSYFVVVFKRYTACTPTEFIKAKTVALPDFFEQNTQSQ